MKSYLEKVSRLLAAYIAIEPAGHLAEAIREERAAVTAAISDGDAQSRTDAYTRLFRTVSRVNVAMIVLAPGQHFVGRADDTNIAAIARAGSIV